MSHGSAGIGVKLDAGLNSGVVLRGRIPGTVTVSRIRRF